MCLTQVQMDKVVQPLASVFIRGALNRTFDRGDLVQEGYLVCLNASDRYQPASGPMARFLWRVVRNHYLSLQKHWASHIHLERTKGAGGCSYSGEPIPPDLWWQLESAGELSPNALSELHSLMEGTPSKLSEWKKWEARKEIREYVQKEA